jgi:hypothetical protein
MKRFGQLIVLALTLTMAFWLAPAPAAAAAATRMPTVRPDGCPIYEACMQFVVGGCSCEGFYCNGRFICGIPIT